MALVWTGLIASVLVVLNIGPRPTLIVCFLCFISFVTTAQDFSEYQSDGMLLEAGFLSLFLAPAGLRPGWGRRSLASRAAILLLLWEWFRIYFESGVVKLASGDPTWRNLTAMYEYYQNGPLPTWIGWYLQHLPLLVPSPHRRRDAVYGTGAGLDGISAPPLAHRLLRHCHALADWRDRNRELRFPELSGAGARVPSARRLFGAPLSTRTLAGRLSSTNRGSTLLHEPDAPSSLAASTPAKVDSTAPQANLLSSTQPTSLLHPVRVAITAVILTCIAYATTVELLDLFWRQDPLPHAPVAALEPFRIANGYGLFAVMTPHRYEIEFQGSDDGVHWAAYPFRYKPQDPHARPRIYAPYQPRFDWNLWFASLGPWQQSPIVPLTEERLLENDRDVLGLFAGNPFPAKPPRLIRAVLWQYWFSTPEQKREQGVWWTRKLLGTFAPTIERRPDGRYGELAPPDLEGPPES